MEGPEVGSREILLAMLALMLEEREIRVSERPGVQRVELLLAQAGLPAATIAQVLNKQLGTVQMALYRAKTKATTGNRQAESVDA